MHAEVVWGIILLKRTREEPTQSSARRCPPLALPIGRIASLLLGLEPRTVKAQDTVSLPIKLLYFISAVDGVYSSYPIAFFTSLSADLQFKF